MTTDTLQARAKEVIQLFGSVRAAADVASLRDQCVNAGVAFLWKQDVLNGKKIGAPQLEGQSWQQFPP